jgi:hypothetical protein
MSNATGSDKLPICRWCGAAVHASEAHGPELPEVHRWCVRLAVTCHSGQGGYWTLNDRAIARELVRKVERAARRPVLH